MMEIIETICKFFGYLIIFAAALIAVMYVVTTIAELFIKLFMWPIDKAKLRRYEDNHDPDALCEGAIAYLQGQDLDEDNPYCEEDPDYELWREGWYHGADEDSGSQGL